MLEELIGGFVSSWDIPKNAVVRKGLYGDLVFSILDTIYDVCYHCMQGKDVVLNKKVIDRRTIDNAINQFKLFNLLTDIDKLIVNNEYTPINADIEYSIVNKYIDSIVPKYFRYNLQQIDCCRIVNGTIGELNLLSSIIDTPMLLDSGVTLRTTKSQCIVIANEVNMLKSLITKFKLINRMLYTIMQNLYKLGAKEKAPIELPEIEL